jgi:flagellar biosynthesis/type III secretory pathway ATPase
MEFFAKKLNYLKEVLGMDTNAVTDRSELVNYIFSAIDPQLASRVIKGDVEASQDEIEDEQRNILVISSGMTPPFKMGVNYQLRLQILQTAVQQMPNFVQALQTNPKAAEAFEKRWKFLQQQVAQEKNKVIGALGVDPVPAPPPLPQMAEQPAAA